ncbi:hypothetical protein NCCP2716_16890 [Sporosarcina sp. NCCP-2716]|uniref:ABC transporter ATP-binding protein n=1 Tax=Sporosarcina sp. NCCP-2716 TaxID=2943679 RepID=UPI00204091C6|nr:ABC transporter ATP-binding protein [Sporosarcina sp. NCCP-2716]GKV69191.1 hypothetical protein NCCP2716_16890 [Sporosarcina sp. NCCP-2716]
MIIEVKNVTKRFGANEVLKGIDLAIPERTICGFVGANGAGKTTLMHCMLGLIPVTTGTITIAGTPVTFGQTASNEHVGYLPDVPEFYPFYSARDYLDLCAVITKLPKSESSTRIAELLDLVGLSGNKRVISTYSRGMKQRLGIAQALLNRPKLLICDEPTSALDPAGRAQILSILQEAKKETAVFFSTHILSDAEQICDRIAMLHEGRLIFNDDLHRLDEQTSGEFAFTFAHHTIEETRARLADYPAELRIDHGALIARLPGDEARLSFAKELANRGLVIETMQPHKKPLEDVVMEVLR